MKHYKRRIAELKDNGGERDILLMIAEGVAENSSKLSWLIGAISVAGGVVVALLIALLARS
jgi:hypothetical protein